MTPEECNSTQEECGFGDPVDSLIDNFILSRTSGNIEGLARYIMGAAGNGLGGMGYQEAEKRAIAKLQELADMGKVMLSYREQADGAPVFEVVG